MGFLGEGEGDRVSLGGPEERASSAPRTRQASRMAFVSIIHVKAL